MVAKFIKYVLRGLFAILPTALSIYVLIWFFKFSENILAKIFFSAFTDAPIIPGMGILIGVLLLFLLGFFLSSPAFMKIFNLFELPFKNVPLVRTVYTAIRDLMLYFNPEKGGRGGQVVILKPPQMGVQIIGLVTNSQLHSLPKEMNKHEYVGVFIPMSYGLGGYTVFVPANWITYTDMPVEQAMKSALMAWIEKEESK